MLGEFLARLLPFSTEGGSDDDESGEGTVRAWDFVPRWQYDGWASQAGGLAVEEQEESLEAVQRRAEALEEGERDAERRE